MSYTTITELFSGICDAIRDKDGTTDPINHQDIPARIAAISSGGGGSILDTPDFLESQPTFWIDADSFVDASTITNKGTSTDAIIAQNIALDSAENALLVDGSASAAMYADISNPSSEAAAYMIFKVVNQNDVSNPYDKCQLSLRESHDSEYSFRFYSNSVNSNYYNVLLKSGKWDSSLNVCKDIYVIVATSSRNGEHYKSFGGCITSKETTTRNSWAFDRLAINCKYVNSNPFTDICKISFKLKCAMVFDTSHTKEQIIKTCSWLSYKYLMD